MAKTTATQTVSATNKEDAKTAFKALYGHDKKIVNVISKGNGVYKVEYDV